jgi:hypothetical protein
VKDESVPLAAWTHEFAIARQVAGFAAASWAEAPTAMSASERNKTLRFSAPVLCAQVFRPTVMLRNDAYLVGPFAALNDRAFTFVNCASASEDTIAVEELMRGLCAGAPAHWP